MDEGVDVVFADVQMLGWMDLSYDDGFDSIGLAQRSFWKRSIKAAGGYLQSPRWLLYKPYEMAELERRIYELLRGG
jgi:hypothetical protein